MNTNWKDMRMTERILWIVNMLAAVAVVVLSVLQLCDVLPSGINFALPLMGLMMLTQAAREWSRSRVTAIFSLCAAAFILACAAAVLFLR